MKKTKAAACAFQRDKPHPIYRTPIAGTVEDAGPYNNLYGNLNLAGTALFLRCPLFFVDIKGKKV